MDIKLLKRLIREAISASPMYMRLEDERELIQRNVVSRIRKGYIKNDKDLRRYLMYLSQEDPLTGKTSSYDLAVTALLDIPFSVWKKIAK